MATPSQDLARLLRLITQPGLTNLPVVNGTAGEVQIIAVGPGPMDQLRLLLDAGREYNLLEYAPQSWWQLSTTLVFSVEQGWLQVLDPDSAAATAPPVIIPASVQYVVQPSNPNIGDLLVWDGVSWVLLSPTSSGYVLTSNGPLTVPSYQPAAGGGGGGNIITGQVTTGLVDGDFAYVSGNDTWLKARSDGTLLQATIRGANLGTPGTMAFSGRIAAGKFTTVGGLPTPGAEVYVAAAADDGGTGAGKMSAAAPTSGYLTKAGICLNNSNYAGFKTCVVLLSPSSPIEL